MLCGQSTCGCVFTSTTLAIQQQGSVISIEQTEFEELEQLMDDVAVLQAQMITTNALITQRVAKSGDDMTGGLTVIPAGPAIPGRFKSDGTPGFPSIRCERTGSSPFIDFVDPAGVGPGGRLGMIQALGSGVLRLWGDGDAVSFAVGGGEVARFTTLSLLIGKTVNGQASVGFEAHTLGRALATVSEATRWNYYSNRIGPADVNGELHVGFHHSGALAGSISRVGASTISFNTSSDERLKTIVDDPELTPELAAWLLEIVQPVFFRWKADGDDGPIICGDIAQRVAELWPGAIDHGLVTPGRGTPEEEAAWQLRCAERQRLVDAFMAAEAENERRRSEAEKRYSDLLESSAATGKKPPPFCPPSLLEVPEIPEEEQNPFLPWSMDEAKWVPIVRLGLSWLFGQVRTDRERTEGRLAAIEAHLGLN